ncbi:hypothetical protein [Pseudodesulfovibrio senegalensis]|jgi:hypothetical protein|uniref:Uncharacterized protein n=1 Tax=Pseudodesulfovibrio senegalensis TaxID=1721087 RepID=A0A6N6N2Q6_9BACT|nr:hypothetical protein [Pseudodesulfovibrio senegalensis]KAB1441695.1 hypothetical protein F8A88_08850 [Pseudodesulfovibrio senegalensis]
MKRFALGMLFSLLLVSGAWASGPAPVSVAGIRLGDDFSRYQDMCRMEHAGAMSDAIFLDEALIRTGAIHGVRGGSIIYGNCANPGKIVRIKIKFADMSKRLFKDLLALYTKRFGDPSSYQGDSFRNVIAWEWDISGSEGRHVKIVLMYSTDSSIRPGVSIKMTDQSLLDLEFSCYKKNFRSLYKATENAGKITDLDLFVPR